MKALTIATILMASAAGTAQANSYYDYLAVQRNNIADTHVRNFGSSMGRIWSRSAGRYVPYRGGLGGSRYAPAGSDRNGTNCCEMPSGD